jgi:hypothetical protein
MLKGATVWWHLAWFHRHSCFYLDLAKGSLSAQQSSSDLVSLPPLPLGLILQVSTDKGTVSLLGGTEDQWLVGNVPVPSPPHWLLSAYTMACLHCWEGLPLLPSLKLSSLPSNLGETEVL